MGNIKQFIGEHRKATIAAAFLLIIFIGGSAVSAVNVANRRTEQAKEDAVSESLPAAPSHGNSETAKKAKLSDAQKETIKGYDDDTKKFIEALSSSIWSAEGGRNTVRFYSDYYVETADGESETHSYAISRIDESSDGYGGTLKTIVFDTDAGTHIVTCSDGKGSAVQESAGVDTESGEITSTIESSSMFSKKNSPYSRTDTIEDIKVKGLNSEITKLLGGDSEKLNKELSKWCAVYYPSTTEAVWNKVASVDWENGTVTTGFTLNTENPTDITAVYKAESGTVEFGR